MLAGSPGEMSPPSRRAAEGPVLVGDGGWLAGNEEAGLCGGKDSFRGTGQTAALLYCGLGEKLGNKRGTEVRNAEASRCKVGTRGLLLLPFLGGKDGAKATTNVTNALQKVPYTCSADHLVLKKKFSFCCLAAAVFSLERGTSTGR